MGYIERSVLPQNHYCCSGLPFFLSSFCHHLRLWKVQQAVEAELPAQTRGTRGSLQIV